MVPRTRVDEAFGLSPGQHPTLADSRPPRSQKLFSVSTSSLPAPRSPLTRASALVARRYLGGGEIEIGKFQRIFFDHLLAISSSAAQGGGVRWEHEAKREPAKKEGRAR